MCITPTTIVLTIDRSSEELADVTYSVTARRMGQRFEWCPVRAEGDRAPNEVYDGLDGPDTIADLIRDNLINYYRADRKLVALFVRRVRRALKC